MKDDPNAEPRNVSRQRISLCSNQMKNSPWIGHSNKVLKCQKNSSIVTVCTRGARKSAAPAGKSVGNAHEK